MAGRLRLSRSGQPWLTCTAVLCAGSLLAWLLPTAWLDWQPEQAWQQPWRWITAAFVHWSPLHLGANLLAAVVVGAYGWAARLPPSAALAWVLAWPLSHGALLVQPALGHYGGLSGVLHAGVAVVCLWLLVDPGAGPGRRRRRAIAAAVSTGLVIKLLSEQPWGPPLRHGTEWDIAVAPLAHATGALAGLFCAAAALAWARRPLQPHQADAIR